jgi:hypothetical protein
MLLKKKQDLVSMRSQKAQAALWFECVKPQAYAFKIPLFFKHTALPFL